MTHLDWLKLFCVLNCTSDLAEVWEWNGGIFILVNVVESRSLYRCRGPTVLIRNSFTNLTWLRDFRFPHRIQIDQRKIVKYFGHSKILKPEFSGEDDESWSSLEQGRREPSRAPWNRCSRTPFPLVNLPLYRLNRPPWSPRVSVSKWKTFCISNFSFVFLIFWPPFRSRESVTPPLRC